MSTDDRPPPEQLGFSGCLQELDEIVRALESDAIDVDELAGRVERATELVHWCRQRLDGTRLRVTEVLDRLDAELDADADPDDPAE
jgi:exodeoxyribonuclease VII small subunit